MKIKLNNNCSSSSSSSSSSETSSSKNIVYTRPEKVKCKKPFTLYYGTNNMNVNDNFELLHKNNVLSTFEPNIKLAQLPSSTPFTYLSNVTINPNTGQCFVSNNIAPNSISVIDKITGENIVYLNGIADGLQEPVGIEFDSKNNMYVANFVDSNIKVFNSTKKLLGTITNSLFKNLGGLGFHNGILYALNGFQIEDIASQYNGLYLMFKIVVNIDNDGNLNYNVSVFCTDTLSVPLFMCFDKNNHCYVTNFSNNTISKINMKNGLASVYINDTQGLLNPRGIAIDCESNLYVSNGDFETKNYFILKINKDKKITIFTTKNLNSPRGLAIDMHGDKSLYVCNLESTLTKITYKKYIFNVIVNILKKDSKLNIIDSTASTNVEKFTLNVMCNEKSSSKSSSKYINYKFLYNIISNKIIFILILTIIFVIFKKKNLKNNC